MRPHTKNQTKPIQNQKPNQTNKSLKTPPPPQNQNPNKPGVREIAQWLMSVGLQQPRTLGPDLTWPLASIDICAHVHIPQHTTYN